MANERLLLSLERAMEDEWHAHYFYKMAAQKTDDPKGKKAFEDLSNEELGHAKFLKGQYESILNTGKADLNTKLDYKSVFSKTSPIFSEDIKSRIKESHYEMSALSVAIQLELSSMHFYKEEAENASDPEIKNFLMELSDWEKTHYDTLLAQQEDLKQHYWATSHFAPF